MEIERHESKVIAKRRCAILDIATLLEKDIKFQILRYSCGHRRNKIMISMLNK
jgi:hypothetical protein